MVLYNFKTIQVVPNGKEFVDIVLTRTQRKTPTVVHKHYPISVIRKFYMRKVKYTQSTIHEKLSQILTDFPVLDDIHPFYADLINVLYDKDHYKLALGQINTARHLVDNVAKDYVRLLKFGDSLYRCKQLKRAALGRMVKIIKRLGSSLGYLEEVRQHLARLPSIDPSTRTILVCGFPNVGKSSFMRKVTRADVEVQPYPFTTKSLFVGHTDYKYLTWQVIDTPGILDHALEDRNTIEMQSITAMAHLRCCILYFIDISEQCGYNIQQQVALFESIAPLFANKPIVIALNKIDQRRPEQLTQEEQQLIQKILDEYPGSVAVPMSTVTDEGIAKVKETACELLLQLKVDMKLKSSKKDEILKRLHVSIPTPRDDKKREPYIPEIVIKGHDGRVAKRKLEEHQTQMELYKNFDPEYKGVDQRQFYDLENPDWRFDTIPEIMDGMNVLDFYSPDVGQRLAELEAEEAERLRQLEALNSQEEDYPTLSADLMEKVKKIREAKKLLIQEHRRNKTSSAPPLPGNKVRKSAAEFEEQLLDLGLNPEKAMESIRERSRSRSRVGRKRTRDEMEVDEDAKRARSQSKPPKPGEGFRDLKQKLVAEMLARKAQKSLARQGRVAESDRRIFNLRPKHLLSGKRGIGKTDRR